MTYRSSFFSNLLISPGVEKRLRCHSESIRSAANRIFEIFISGVTCALLLSCAAQAPPRPPRVERPERVTDLTVHQIGASLEVSFTRPSTATDGELLTKPLEVEFSRVISPAGEAAPQAPGSWVALSGADLARATHADKVNFSDRISPSDYRQSLGAAYTFWVRTLTRGFRNRAMASEPSNAARITFLDVSGPVEGLRVEPTEHALKLTWPAPEMSLSGRRLDDLSGYRIYRSETGQPGSFRLVGEGATPAYEDRDFQFDHSYFYKVRALFKRSGQMAESDDSSVASITPRDTFPPQAPARLSAVYAPGAVELIWNANTEADLAGYNVYRGEEGVAMLKINRDLVRTPVYRDSSVKVAHAYEYRVTAVDLHGNESEPSEPVRIETR